LCFSCAASAFYITSPARPTDHKWAEGSRANGDFYRSGLNLTKAKKKGGSTGHIFTLRSARCGVHYRDCYDCYEWIQSRAFDENPMIGPSA
jgi:hypothetical protein